MNDATAVLPPKVRAAIYLLLICASVTLLPLMAAGVVPSLYGSIVQGLLGVFGGATALANVNRAPDAVAHVEVYDPKHD